jgi:hypothetical protein
MTMRKMAPGRIGSVMQIGVMTALLFSVLAILVHSFGNVSPQSAHVATDAEFIAPIP